MQSGLRGGRTFGMGLLALLVGGSAVLAQPTVRTVKPAATPVTIDVPPSASAPEPAVSRATVPPAEAGGEERGTLSVVVDRAKIIRLPDRTSTVVIGNPAIADLAIQKSGIVIVTGKSFGVTNVIALDAGGQVLAESTVTVKAPADAIVTVQRGEARKSYSCNPSCLPSVQLGDANEYFSEQKSQAEQRNAFATPR